MKQILRLIFISLSLVWGTNTLAFSYDHVRTERKSFPVEMGAELQVLNKYGDISVGIGPSDSIIVKATIKCYSEKEEKLEQLKHVVRIHMSGGEDYVSVETDWNHRNAFQKGWTDVRRLFGANNKIEVYYDILVPEDTEIDIENRFGNVRLPDLKEKISVEVEHGNIYAKRLKEVKHLDISYGKLSATEITEGKIEAKFSRLRIKKAGQIEIIATGKEVQIDAVDELELTMRSGNVELEEVGEIKLSTNLSDIEIDHLKGKLSGSVKMGDLVVKHIETGFRGINLITALTDTELTFDQKIAFNYHLSLSGNKDFVMPVENNSLEEETVIDKERILSGVVATIPVGGKPANVYITTRSSRLSLVLD